MPKSPDNKLDELRTRGALEKKLVLVIAEHLWYAGVLAEIPNHSRLCLKTIVAVSSIATSVVQTTIAPTMLLLM